MGGGQAGWDKNPSFAEKNGKPPLTLDSIRNSCYFYRNVLSCWPTLHIRRGFFEPTAEHPETPEACKLTYLLKYYLNCTEGTKQWKIGNRKSFSIINANKDFQHFYARHISALSCCFCGGLLSVWGVVWFFDEEEMWRLWLATSGKLSLEIHLLRNNLLWLAILTFDFAMPRAAFEIEKRKWKKKRRRRWVAGPAR